MQITGINGLARPTSHQASLELTLSSM